MRFIVSVLFMVALQSGCSHSQNVELLIQDGQIIDGSGGATYTGDIWVDQGKITYVGPAKPVTPKRVISAKNKIVSPGFIDPHTHAGSDLRNPESAVNEAYLRQGVTTVFIGNDGRGKDVNKTLAILSAQGIGTNVGMFAGHGSIRNTVLKMEDRAPTSQELIQMRDVFRAELAAGAFGLSSGLFYAPGSFATKSEVIALAKEMQRTGGVYETHIRDEGNYNIGLQASVAEAIDIGRSAAVPVHLAHLKALGPAVHGQGADIVEQVNEARKAGVRVTADQYPWLASGTRLSNALLPRSIMTEGVGAMNEILSRDVLPETVHEAVAANAIRRGGPEALLITGESPHRGLTLAQAADREGETILATVAKIVREGDPSVASFMMSEPDLYHIGTQPWVVTSSDGTNGHPRKFGSFPEKYQKFVRDQQHMSIEQFVAQSSHKTAEIFNICQRGRLAEGYWADIVIWDAESFRSVATYQTPRELSEGMAYVIVNGAIAIDDGKLNETKAGIGLRRQDCL